MATRKIVRPSHAATLVRGPRPKFLCDCGKPFPAKVNPHDGDDFDSPTWEAHVKDMRSVKS